jgi:ABC-type branched-subunit amino acid transport system substrate-binding protein
MVEGLKRAGRDLTADSFVKAMDTIKDFQGIGPKITFGPKQRQGARSVFLAKCAEGGKPVRLSDYMTSNLGVHEVIKRMGR